mgnify:CR=1 FL=1
MGVWFEEQPAPAIIRCYKISVVSAMKWNYPLAIWTVECVKFISHLGLLSVSNSSQVFKHL